MKEFSLAFPLPMAPDQVYPWMIAQGWIASAPSANEIFFKGVPFLFRVAVQPPHPDLPTIFAEHCELAKDDA